MVHNDNSVQDCGISTADAMEIPESCAEASILDIHIRASLTNDVHDRMSGLIAVASDWHLSSSIFDTRLAPIANWVARLTHNARRA